MASDRPPHEPREREVVLPSRRRRPSLARAVVVLVFVALVAWWLWALFVDGSDEGVIETPQSVTVERGAEDGG